MQDKQKVTLYLPPELHRQLKIRAAVDSEPMSALAEQAIDFYLAHSDVVEQVEASRGVYGAAHQMYNCPECHTPMTLRSGEVVSLKQQPSVISEEELTVRALDSEELVPARV